MSKVLLIVPIFLFCYSSVLAQFFHENDAISTGLSGSDAAYTGTSLFCQNPALFAQARQSHFGFSYYNPYLLPELSTTSMAAVFRTEGGSIGTCLGYFGSSLYNESKLSLGYGHQLFKKLDAGIKLNYQHRRVEVLNTFSSIISGELGLTTRLSDELSLGLMYSNVSNTGNSVESELPVLIKLGIAYSQKKDYFCTLQLTLIDYSEITASVAFEYWLKNIFVLRSGVAIENDVSYSFGCGIAVMDLNLNLGFRQHACLGLSSGITVIYHFNKNEKE